MSFFSDTKTFNLRIYTPEKLYYSGDVKSVTIPGVIGRFQILVNHAPIISSVEYGLLEVVTKNDIKDFYFINTGCIQFEQNKLNIIVNEIDKINEIDILKIKTKIEIEIENLNNATTDKLKEIYKQKLLVLETKLKCYYKYSENKL